MPTIATANNANRPGHPGTTPRPGDLDKYIRRGPRYTSYPTAVEFSPAVDSVAFESELARIESGNQQHSLYIHIPFCRSLCTYCGCNMVVRRDTSQASRYLDCLDRELAMIAGSVAGKIRLQGLHWGGGTPNFLSDSQICRLWTSIHSRFELNPDGERSIELDPRCTTPAQLELLKELGFQRISFGVQDFSPNVQQAINRQQSVDLLTSLTAHARRIGIKGINFDLILGLPHQTPDSFATTLRHVIRLRPDRIAAYNFAWLPTLKKHHQKIQPEWLPAADVRSQIYERTHQVLCNAGYRHIGLDHFALADDPLVRAQDDGRLFRNFQGYTTGHDQLLLGAGMSAISQLEGCFAQNRKTIRAYMDAIESGKFATDRGTLLTDDDHIRSAAIQQIMCNFKLDLDALSIQLNRTMDGVFADELERLQVYQRDGLIRFGSNGFSVTDIGRYYVRTIAMEFDAYRRGNGETGTFSQTA